MKDLKIKKLIVDSDAVFAFVLLVLLAVAPVETFARVVGYPEIFGVLVAIVFGGRYGLRMIGAKGTADIVAAGQSMPGILPPIEGGYITDDEMFEAEQAAHEVTETE